MRRFQAQTARTQESAAPQTSHQKHPTVATGSPGSEDRQPPKHRRTDDKEQIAPQGGKNDSQSSQESSPQARLLAGALVSIRVSAALLQSRLGSNEELF